MKLKTYVEQHLHGFISIHKRMAVLFSFRSYPEGFRLDPKSKLASINLLSVILVPVMFVMMHGLPLKVSLPKKLKPMLFL
jgi:hypothetical protein